jgi:hypothetical protein
MRWLRYRLANGKIAGRRHAHTLPQLKRFGINMLRHEADTVRLDIRYILYVMEHPNFQYTLVAKYPVALNAIRKNMGPNRPPTIKQYDRALTEIEGILHD